MMLFCSCTFIRPGNLCSEAACSNRSFKKGGKKNLRDNDLSPHPPPQTKARIKQRIWGKEEDDIKEKKKIKSHCPGTY